MTDLPPERMTVLRGALKGDWYTADQMRAYAEAAIKQERERADALARALEQCITDAPYPASVGAPNRIAAINKIACDALRARNESPHARA